MVWEVKVKVSSYTAQYPVLVTAQSALHFTPWQTYSFQRHLELSGKHSAEYSYILNFTLHPLADLFIPTPSRVIWGAFSWIQLQTQLYTSPPGRPIHSNAISSYMGSIQLNTVTDSTLHFTPWQTYSFQRHLELSGEHSAEYSYRLNFTLHPLADLFIPTPSRVIWGAFSWIQLQTQLYTSPPGRPIHSNAISTYLGSIQLNTVTDSTLHFTPWQTYSFQRHLDLSGEHSAEYSYRLNFTLHPLADLFIPTPSRLIWGAFSWIQLQTQLYTSPPGRPIHSNAISTYLGSIQLNTVTDSTLHFTPWQTYSFQRHLELSGEHSAEYSYRLNFTLHPLADLFIPTPSRVIWGAFSWIQLQTQLYTSPPGRPIHSNAISTYLGSIQLNTVTDSTLHFTPWQTYSFQRHLDLSGEHSAEYSYRLNFTLHPLADLFIPTPSRVIWEAFSWIQLQTQLYTSPPGRPIHSNAISTYLGSIQLNTVTDSTFVEDLSLLQIGLHYIKHTNFYWHWNNKRRKQDSRLMPRDTVHELLSITWPHI